MSTRSQRYYAANTEAVKARAATTIAKIRRRNTQLIRDRKSVPCADCNVQYPFWVMQFDHCRGEKLFNISDRIAKQIRLDKLLAEIDKCDVVCANCHADRTWQRANHAPLV